MSSVSSPIGRRRQLFGALALAAVGCQSKHSGDDSASQSVVANTVAVAPATVSATAQLADPTATELTTKERPTTAEVASLSSSAITSATSNGAKTPGETVASHVAASSAQAPNIGAANNIGVAKPLASKPTTTGPTAGGKQVSRPAAALVASAAVTGEGYRTYLQMSSPLALGSEAMVTVHLEPQAPFKSNDKYPYRFTVSSAEGASAPAAAVTSAQISPTRTTLHFPVTAKKVGRASVSGTFAFSVCTEEKCLVERAPLVLGFEVVADAVSATPNP